MGVESHLEELQRKHNVLEGKIESEARYLSANDLHLQELKRQKLLLKDKIETIEDRCH